MVYHAQVSKSDSHSDSHSSTLVGLTLGIGLGLAVLLAAACGSDDGDSADTVDAEDVPTVVVSTDVLGDVVSKLLGDAAAVVTIMPTGADPHEFQPSAREVATITGADVLVVNGAGFEAGLDDTIESAERDGVPVCTAIDSVDTIDLPDGASHDDEDGADDHDESGVDPHFFTDPARMADAAEGLTDCVLASVPALDNAEIDTSSAAYVAELEALDAEVEATLEPVPQERRTLVTNHEVFGYFADRYGFEIAGVIVPSGSTQSEADAAGLAALADMIESEDVPAIFADTSASDQLADALAAEVGDIEVVELFSESLGPDGGDTYVNMTRTNARRIADALG